MYKKLKRIVGLAMLAPLGACSSSMNIFPEVPLTTNANELELPNPLSIVADPANDQIIVVNSNFDYFYDRGSIYTLDVDTTNPDSVVLTATDSIAVPNFAGQASFDGTNLYVPFRQAYSTEDPAVDQVGWYTVGAGVLTEVSQVPTGKNPFGSTLSGGVLYVANDKQLHILSNDLDSLAQVSLTAAAEADITDSGSRLVEAVAVDAATNRAFLSNRGGKLLVVDLDTNTLTHVVSGPDNTRGIATDGRYLYAVDGNPPALWVLDPLLLPEADNAPDEVDDAFITVGVIDLGANPNAVALDVANNRAYVTNTGDPSVSIIDTVLRSEIARVSFDKDDTGFDDDGEDPLGLAVGSYGGVPYVFVANTGSNTLFVINANTLNIVEAYP